jgi:hypothetical protein
MNINTETWHSLSLEMHRMHERIDIFPACTRYIYLCVFLAKKTGSGFELLGPILPGSPHPSAGNKPTAKNVKRGPYTLR